MVVSLCGKLPVEAFSVLLFQPNDFIRMEGASLDTVASDVICRLSLYLLEEDVEALSETCVYIYNVLNDNLVWKRFLLRQHQNLLCQSQQLHSPFEPDPSLCKNRKLIQMKNHLVSNWRNGKCVEYSEKTDHRYASGVFNVPKGKGQLIYKDNYLFLGRFTDDIHSDAIEVWDIRREPVLHSVIPMGDETYDSYYLFDHTLAVVVCSRVDVYEINVESKEFPLLYSFLITEDEVVWGKPAIHEGRHNMRCVGWSHYRVQNFLISNKCDDEPYYPVLHVWDISNACKVGAFVSPMVGFSITVHSFEGNDWYLSQNRQSGHKVNYFTFNISSMKFSDTVFEYDGSYPTHLLFYKRHLIMFKNAEDADSEGWYDSVCEVYNMDDSTKLQERCFDNAHKNYILSSTTIVDGKFVILCKGCFLVIDALSLETVNSIPYESNVCFITHQINVFGNVFVVTSEKNYSVGVWDVEKKNKLQTQFKGGYNCHLYVNESCTKLVILYRYKIYLMHFW